MMRARNGQVGTVKMPCTPKNSRSAMEVHMPGQAAWAMKPITSAPTSRNSASIAWPRRGAARAMRSIRKSARVIRRPWMVAPICRKTMPTTECAAISATPVMGALKKERPMTSAQISSISAKVQIGAGGRQHVQQHPHGVEGLRRRGGVERRQVDVIGHASGGQLAVPVAARASGRRRGWP
jgi:hypothetical protein